MRPLSEVLLFLLLCQHHFLVIMYIVSCTYLHGSIQY